MRSPAPLNRRAGGRQGAAGADPRWIWGVHAVLAALANPRRRIERVVATRNGAERLPGGVAADLMEPAAIDALLTPGAVHQGVALRAEALEPFALDEACMPANGRAVVVLDGVTDPQNVGAIFRSAAAFDARAVIMQDRKSPPLTGVLAKAAAGAVEVVPHVRAVNLSRAVEALNAAGYVSIALAGDASMTLEQALGDGRSPVIVLGAEGAGVRDLVAATCDLRASIPMAPAMESLNVSAAAAVALYLAQSRRA